MIYDWRKIEDLTKASIFDLTDDIELIRECIGFSFFEMKDQQDYIEQMTESMRVGNFEAFAYETRDEEFAEHLKVVCKDYYDALNQLREGAFWE